MGWVESLKRFGLDGTVDLSSERGILACAQTRASVLGIASCSAYDPLRYNETLSVLEDVCVH
jgi:hypothetical protein